MALVHSPFINPPELQELAESKYTDDLDKQTRAFGHMITYMDDIIGKLRARLKQHGIDEETLILFTGDNGTGRPITSKLPGMDLKGGKGTMTEAGSRVPLLACWPGKIPPGVREEFFCLVDVVPTIASIAGIDLNRNVDGMNLSHDLFGKSGTDREHILINYGKGFFVREKRFRLNQNGKFYDIPVTSNASRYSEKVVALSEHPDDHSRLKKLLDDFMDIKDEYADVKAPPEAKSGHGRKKRKKANLR